jgi:hypothetical protein
MTTITKANSESIWSSIKNNLRNPEMPQVINLTNKARVVYYPANSTSREAGYKNQNCGEYTLVSPSGALVTFTNLSAFCKDVFGVTESTNRPKYVSSFSELFSGKRKEDNVHGWTLPEEDKYEAEEDTEALELLAN